ncbi:multidrug efflux system membrane fusion protein [Silvibacterium bohemicum]|uniref:Multidrug efflux system membrane fusion protein n=1 Tax=Silvibacterium bohemicum TaxID=1577686 RepID=A0A841JMK4_9BACT|nr:biotin/lipoyl-binding protein [Silvibacterium bohemicum]MBB6142360.1 multidrug efflux system membrane fusion protein [Silvibacterium bohemicum]
MTLDESSQSSNRAGRVVSVVIILCATITGLLVLNKVTNDPRTDDAEIFANYIGIAPLVNGPITKLNVVDNQLVKQGERLFEIDGRPYAYALARAKSDQVALAGEINDERRVIAGKVSGVDVAKASALSSEASLNRSSAAIEQAKADVSNAKAAVERANADLAYATNNLHRIEPLLAKQFVTVDQIDQARTLEITRSQETHQARAQLALAEAGLDAAKAQYAQSQATLVQSHQQVQQASHNVTTLEPLEGQVSGKQAVIDTAQYNFDNCKVDAPFDARVTNLIISQGAYATAGQQIFTLIDTRTWWAIANFRETQLRHIRPGMPAEVYVLSRPNVHYQGVVDSVGFGVTPDADLIGSFSPPGLPDVQRTLNWVHLASRFPVRVRLEAQPNEVFRLGESAVVVIRGESSLATRR